MKQMKRMLALLLALVMIVGVLPMSVFADEYGTATGDFDIKNELVDAAIVFTDLHTNKSDDKQSTVAGIMGALKATGLPFSSVTSGGDAFSVNSDSGKYTGYTSTITGYIRDALGNSTIPVNYAWSDHDRYALQEDDKTLLDKTSHLVYGAGVDGIYGTSDDGNYYVYVLSMADLSTNDRYNAGLSSSSEVQKAIENFKTDAEKLLKDRPLLIVSHQPLLDRRNDNGHAYDWALAINEVAEDMDVAFFHGHNHKYDEPGDYYYAKGSTMSVCSDSSGNATNVVLNFAHITAGYMEPTSTGSYSSSGTRRGVAVAVEIYERTIKFVTYDKNGVYTGSYALNETVDRDHADANVPKSLAVTGKIDYTVGDAIVEPTEVKVTYMSGDTAEAENYKLAKITKNGVEVTLVDNKFAEAGEYVLTYTCTVGNYQAQAELKVTVAAAPSVDEEEKPEEIKLPVVAGANVTEVKDVTAEIKLEVENVTNYVAYDIVAEMTGDTAMVSIPVPSDWVVGELKAYYVDENGNLTDESFDVSYVDGYATFTVTHFSTYALTNTVAELNWIEIPGQSKTIFRLTNSLDTNKNYVIVNRNTAGTGSAIILNRNGNSYSIGNTDVTVIADSSGNYIEVPDKAAQWTFTTSSKLQNDRYLTATDDNAFGNAENSGANYTTWSYSTANGLRARRNNNSDTYRTFGNYRIYVEDQLATPAVYAAMEGPTTFSFGVGEGDRADIEAAITVWTATDANGNGKDLADSFNLVLKRGTENYGTPGTFTMAVMYQGKELGEITVTVSNLPSLKITEGGEEKDSIVRTNVQVGDKIQLGVIAFNGSDNVTNPTITWSIPDEDITEARVDANGLVTVLNNNTSFWVHASWMVNGVEETAAIEIGVSPDDYLTPNVSTEDFPEYPNQGAIRYDKTATAVGSFSETGVAQMELSMTGIPYGKGVDVVIVIDTSSSMKKDKNGQDQSSYTSPNARYQIMRESLRDMLRQFDGFNVDLAIVDFNGYSSSTSSSNSNNFIPGSNVVGNSTTDRTGANKGKVYTGNEANTYILNTTLGANHFENTAADAFNEARINQIYNYFTGGSSGTNYDFGIESAYKLLAAKKEANGDKPRDQYVIFLTDGAPFRYNGFTANNNDGRNEMDKLLSGDYADVAALKRAFSWMSDDVAAMYNPVNGTHPHRMAEAIKGTPGQIYYAVDSTKTTPYLKPYEGLGATFYAIGFCIADDMTNNASDIVKEETSHEVIRTLSSGEGYYWEDVEDKDELTGAFTNIAKKITDAATDIVVTDKITEQYHMIFGIPKTKGDDEEAAERNAAVQAALADQELYIEVVNYTLNDRHDRTGAPDELLRIYLRDSNGATAGGTYSAAINAGGTAAAAPVFDEKEEDKKGYWSVVAADYAVNANDIVINVNGTHWKFMVNGDGTHNVISGAYAFGNIDSVTNISEDLVIVTPYFAYSASTRMLSWTVSKVEEFKEIALRYFLFLDSSSTEIGTTNETPEGTYPTNEWATLTYTNFNGNECRQEFPVPQMTWNGAQVSYVFYLVNGNGEPVNRAGQVVDFANAVFVTDIFTEHVVWNDTNTNTTQEGIAYLDANWFATDKLPDGYHLYDNEAYYELKVYEDAQGNNLDNYFEIAGSETNGKTASTTKVYNTKAGTKYSAYGTYYKDDVEDKFDFANTTVAFAVVWEMKLIEDTVVVDFGLDVLINVVQNDFLQNTVSGISTSNAGYVNTNKNLLDNPSMNGNELNIDGHTITVESQNQIRFHQNSMSFKKAIEFFYESKVIYYEGGDAQTGYMYSKVTVIPATTIYYEDSFISEDDLKTYAWAGTGWGEPTTGFGTGSFDWKLDGAAMNNTQDQDRPGPSEISAALDADNNYGYDGAYKNMSHYSMGSALKAHVDYDHMATASFNFWGTGFDVISLTSSTTGTIIVNVYKGNNTEPEESFVVNTYYGFECQYWSVTYKYTNGEWVVYEEKKVDAMGTVNTAPEAPKEGDSYTTYETRWVPTTSNNPNALYQVPVMKISELPYGQYRAEIKVVYDPIFDQGLYEEESYDFFLDAIRIYDPTGNKDETSNEAYLADGEAWPEYFELRDHIISADKFNSLVGTGAVNGIVFIDGNGQNASIDDYTSYGPNNELYLAAGQAIAFDLNAAAEEGYVDKIQIALKTVGGSADVEIYTVVDGEKDKVILGQAVSTATDMYYTLWKSEAVKNANGTTTVTQPGTMTLVIRNSGESGIVSITNVKITYTANQNPTEATNDNLFSVNAKSILGALLTLKGKDPIVMPNVPAEPELPVLPEQPVKPVQPIKPGKPVQPGKPIKPVKPVQPVQPVVPGKPVQPNKPVMPGKPVRPGSNLAVALY